MSADPSLNGLSINNVSNTTVNQVSTVTSVPVENITSHEGMFWRHLVAGGIAGAVSRTFTAPLDRVKVILQVHGAEIKTIRFCFKHMYREGGLVSMWRGNGINVIKIAGEAAVKYSVYDKAKQIVLSSRNRELSFFDRVISGAFAGGLSQSFIYPLEVLKTRLCLRTTGQYNGLIDAGIKIYQREGLRAFFRGYLINLCGIVIYGGIDLPLYETLKRWYLRTHFIQEEEEEQLFHIYLILGVISSSCGQLVCYPLALVRTRLQAQIHHETSFKTIFHAIFREEGFRGFYRGIMPNFMKVAPSVGINYMVYEQVRQLLGARMS